RQEIARFAYRPDHIRRQVLGARRRLVHWLDLVMGLIKRWADQVVHAGIDDDERLGLSVLEIEDARHQNSGIADDQPAGLEDQLTIEAARRALDHRGIGGGVWRRLVVLALRNTQTAPQIDRRDM